MTSTPVSVLLLSISNPDTWAGLCQEGNVSGSNCKTWRSLKKNVRRQQESRKGRIVLMRAVTVNVFMFCKITPERMKIEGGQICWV